MKIKLKILLSIVLIYTDSLAYEVEDQEFDRTPIPCKEAPQTVGPTPGRLMAERQAKELDKSHFVKALVEKQKTEHDPSTPLTDHIIASWEKEATVFIDSWGVDWITLGDVSLSFEDPKKRSALNSLISKIQRNQAYFGDQYFSVYGRPMAIKGDLEQVHADRLDGVVTRYFSNLYPSCQIHTAFKPDGVQLGVKVQIDSSPPCLYYVKTHSEGRLSQKSTAAKTVVPAELLAYKVLELSGFGCEVHFMARSPQDVYIATLDANSHGLFREFEKASGLRGRGAGDGADEIGLGRRLWGTLNDALPDTPSQTKEEGMAIETAIQGDALAQNFVTKAASLDLLSRILRLHDLLNNPNNFGFVLSTDRLPSLKVIDFRVIVDPRMAITFDHFGSFIEGNGLYNYVQSHKTVGYVLRNRQLSRRVATALDILTGGPLSTLQECVARGYEEVHNFLANDEAFVPERTKLLENLDMYHDAIIHNVAFFTESLSQWKPE